MEETAEGHVWGPHATLTALWCCPWSPFRTTWVDGDTDRGERKNRSPTPGWSQILISFIIYLSFISIYPLSSITEDKLNPWPTESESQCKKITSAFHQTVLYTHNDIIFTNNTVNSPAWYVSITSDIDLHPHSRNWLFRKMMLTKIENSPCQLLQENSHFFDW